jgi:glutamate dehydrogenase/leucine dehydrogenase
MLEKLRAFESSPPEIIFSWKDPETEAEGWVVINSLRGGAAGGGTRMRKGLDLQEVISLAKTMEIKFEVSGPPIGGAKSGINFDPKDPRKEGVLKRWFNAVIPLLKHYYGTGGDLNIDEIKEVIPITSALHLFHPQQGIVIGHLRIYKDEKNKVFSQLKKGVSMVLKAPELTPDISREYKVADMITGYGIAMSVIHFYSIWGGNHKGKKVILQGFGNVGGPAAFYLSQAGLKIVGITDSTGGIIVHDGLELEGIKELLKNRKDNMLNSPLKINTEQFNQQIAATKAEVFIPAAGSRLVSSHLLGTMIPNGLELISCGANVPFMDEEIFFGPTGLYADNNVAVIPDFIANCGMARVFAYLMKNDAKMDEQEIFNDVSNTIRNILVKVHQENPEPKQISQKSLDIILNSINQNR